MLARAPLSLRSQVTRLRVSSPARYAHGHGEYHVCLACCFLTVFRVDPFSSAFTLCFPGQETRSFWHQAFSLPPLRFQHSFCRRGIPAVRLSFSSLSTLLKGTLCRKKSGAA